MNPELDELLCRRYPLIFAQRDQPDSCMHWGFTCGDGWFGIIDALCACIQNSIDLDGTPQAVATQVKEKFGTLRFRIGSTGANPEIRGMIRMAEAMSERVCELSGELKADKR